MKGTLATWQLVGLRGASSSNTARKIHLSSWVALNVADDDGDQDDDHGDGD